MTFTEFLEMAMKWAWGTLLTAIVTAVLTMFLKHGRRWFRGARKFIRTGRIGARPNARRMAQPQAKPAAVKPQRYSLSSVLQALEKIGRVQGRSSTTQTNDAATSQNDVPLDMKF